MSALAITPTTHKPKSSLRTAAVRPSPTRTRATTTSPWLTSSNRSFATPPSPSAMRSKSPGTRAGRTGQRRSDRSAFPCARRARSFALGAGISSSIGFRASDAQGFRPDGWPGKLGLPMSASRSSGSLRTPAGPGERPATRPRRAILGRDPSATGATIRAWTAADPAPAFGELLVPARWLRSPQRSRTTKPTVRERGRASHWRGHESRHI